MARSKRVFVSDVHLGDDARYADPEKARRPRYEPEVDGLRLANFLERQVLATQSDVRDLVLLGDIFDTWVCPFDAEPPTYESIFNSKGNQKLLDVLREIAQTDINLYYVNGNHDYDLTKETIETQIPGLEHIAKYIDEPLKLYAEHGHHYTLFNGSYEDVADGLPIGYYITRFTEHLGKGMKKYVRGWKDLVSYSDEFAGLLAKGDNLFVSILEGLAERVGATSVVMPDKEIPIDQILRAYAPLGEKITPFEAGVQLVSEGDLERHGDRICRTEGYKAVVFGHTHEGKIDKDTFAVTDRIYVNSGTWVGKDAHCVVAYERNAPYSICIELTQIDHEGGTVQVRTESV